MGLKIRDVEFPHHVFMGPGLRGFFGEGYWFHILVRLFFGNIWAGMNFVAKTTTLNKRRGNLELKKDGFRMKRLFPRCIIILWLLAVILNAVGLSGPGFLALLSLGRWQKRGDKWILSFMAVGETKAERLEEYRQFIDLLKSYLPELLKNGTQIVLQLNFGCPNTENPPETLRQEIIECLEIAHGCGLPIMLNFNALVPPSLLLELEQTGLVDCFWIANTIPYNTHHLGEILFGTAESPLRRRGINADGGLSGLFCLIYTIRCLESARAIGVTLPIIAGNGAQSRGAIKALKEAGANGVEITALAITRPRRVRRIVRYANKIFAQGESDANSDVG